MAQVNYSGLYNVLGDNCNIEAVCPYYDPENQAAFTWRRDERGVAIVSGYDPENDSSIHWLCDCGNFITDGCCHCSDCGAESPWGCDCGLQDDEYDSDLDIYEDLCDDGEDWDFEPDYEATWDDDE